MTHEEVLQDMLDACEGGDHLEIYVEVTGRAGLAIIDEDGDEVEAYFHHDLTREQREAVIALYVPPADDARYGCGSAMDWPPQ